jgi:hypothetical protein
LQRFMATRLSRRRWLLRDVAQLGVLSVVSLAGLAIVALSFEWPILQLRTTDALLPAKAVKPPTDTGNAYGVYTGSILFVPPRGEICDQWMFDNRTGALRDNGRVNCRPDAARPERDGVTPATRMIAIGKAFKGD